MTENEQILSLLKDLSLRIDSIENNKNNHYNQFRSREFKEFSEALSLAQGEYKIASKNRKGGYGNSRYADMESVVESTREALVKYGFSIEQKIVFDPEGLPVLLTELIHKTGQWSRSIVKIDPAKPKDPQEFAKYNTWMKRICYNGITSCVQGEGNLDDDAQSASDEAKKYAMEEFAKKKAISAPKPIPLVKKNNEEQPISEEQLESLEHELKGYPAIAKQVLAAIGIETLRDMYKSEFQLSLDKIRKLKELNDSVKKNA